MDMVWIGRDAEGRIVRVMNGPAALEDGTPLTETDPLPADDPEVVAFLAPPPPSPRWMSKVTIYRRMSNDELEAFDTFMRTQATVRQRRTWDDSQEVPADDPELVALATALFGAERAAELLA